MHRGYIKLWRKLKDNPLWLSERFTKGQAWIDLLMLANHKKNMIDIRGIMVEIDSGQILAGGEFLSVRWKWSRGKVSRFLTYLESKTVQQIVQQKSNVCTVISITNWHDYQGNGTADGATDGQQTGSKRTADGHTKECTNTTKNIGRFQPPSLQQVKERIKEMGYAHVNPDSFWNHYEANGWMVGKVKMKNWHRSIAGWESRANAECRTQTSDGIVDL